MKRTRAAAKNENTRKIGDAGKTKDDAQNKALHPSGTEQNKESKSEITELSNNAVKQNENHTEVSMTGQQNVQKPKSRINLKNLKDRGKALNNELKPNSLPRDNKIRGVVDLQLMSKELEQLEDPPITPWEKELCSARLDFSFFDVPCEDLAQHLLGKVLVRRLENGTILKGRIVETEGYLGKEDKASHSYQNKITPRNIPMYMPPGTIYVYMTYGMYHCFNISSQELESHVLIRAAEPLLGFEYMELLRNMRLKENKKEKTLARDVRRLKPYELCNDPSKLCAAFVIDCSLDREKIYACNDLWIEHEPNPRAIPIVAAPKIGLDPSSEKQSTKLLRYYVLGSFSVSHRDMQYEEFAYVFGLLFYCKESWGKILGDGSAVLIRAVDPIEGIEHMVDQRNIKAKPNAAKRVMKDFKVHELCNGPSKLCMAFQLQKSHSKYSMCTWKGLWLENDPTNEEIRIVRSKRIGIDSCGPEWADKPLRYYIYGNRSVSKRDKKAEAALETY